MSFKQLYSPPNNEERKNSQARPTFGSKSLKNQQPNIRSKPKDKPQVQSVKKGFLNCEKRQEKGRFPKQNNVHLQAKMKVKKKTVNMLTLV